MKMASYRLKLIENLIPSKESKIIEIGCGNGEITDYLHSKGFRKIKATDNNLIPSKSKPVNFEKKDAFEINYSKYDVIIAWGVFEYILNLEKFLDKLSRETKKGVVIIFSVPNVCSLSKRIRVFFGKSPNREIIPSRVYSFETIKHAIKQYFPNYEVFGDNTDSIKNIYFKTPKSMSGQIIGIIRK